MLKTYFTYRQIWDNRTNKYNVSYYNNLQYKDFVDAWLTKMTDWSNFIPENRITTEVADWIKSLRRAWMLEFNDNLDRNEMEDSLRNVAWNFWLTVKTVEEMRQWIRDNCSLEEVETWKFEIYPERTDEVTWETIPAKYLIIN